MDNAYFFLSPFDTVALQKTTHTQESTQRGTDPSFGCQCPGSLQKHSWRSVLMEIITLGNCGRVAQRCCFSWPTLCGMGSFGFGDISLDRTKLCDLLLRSH